MDNRLDTQQNGAPLQNELALRSSAQAQQPGRASRPGMFSRLLSDFGLNNNQSATAYVRRGESVTFSGLPFFDQFGNPVDPNDPGTFRRTEAGHRGQRPAQRDNRMNRELMLSENHGTAQLIPAFRERAAEHLLQTDELRMGILSGELETPGNRSHVLKKQLEEERKANEGQDPKLWLQEVRAHLAQSPDIDAARLAAHAEAMSDADKQMERTRKELRNPLERDVQPFQPPTYSKSKTGLKATTDKSVQTNQNRDATNTAEPVTKNQNPAKAGQSSNVSFKNEMSEKPALNGAKTSEHNARVATESGAGLLSQLRATTGVSRSSGWNVRTQHSDDAELSRSDLRTAKAVPRVTVTRSNETAADVQKSQSRQDLQSPTSRSARLATRPDTVLTDPMLSRAIHRASSPSVAASAGGSDPSLPMPELVAKPAPAARSTTKRAARNRVSAMQQNGWHVHTPNTKKSITTEASSSSLAKDAPSEKARKRRGNVGAQRKQANNTSKNVAGKSDHKDKSSTISVAAKPNLVGNLGTAVAARGGRAIPTSAQGLQNLQELMQRVSSQAKVLKGDGIIRVQVPLKPAKLGNVLLNIIRNQGKYTVTLTAERMDAVRGLEQQLPAIREHLASQGIQVERIDVESGHARQNDAMSEQQRRESAERESSRANERERNTRSQRQDAETVDADEDSRRGPLNTGLATVEYLG